MSSVMTIERPSADLGSKLREARERKGMSLRQIANSTKIAVAVLDGLERNDISKLPSGIFGRAFVRSFATEIGLDPEATIQEFMAQFREESVAVGHAPSEQIVDNEAVRRKRRMTWTLLGLAVVGLPLAAIVAYVGLSRRHDLSLAFRKSSPAVEAPASTIETPASAASLAPTPASTNEPAPRRAAEDTVLPPPPVVNQPVVNQPVVKAAPAGDGLVVTLAVSRRCWVVATVDGRRQFAQVLRPGERRSFDARKDFSLHVGDAGAVKMTINGVEAKPLGKSGEVLTARVSLRNVKSYLSTQ